MSQVSLRELDHRLRSLKMSDLLAMNMFGEQHQAKTKSRNYNIAYIIIATIILIQAIPILPNADLATIIQIILSAIVLVIAIWALVIGGAKSLLGVAGIASLVGIYNLIFANVIAGEFSFLRIVIGVLNILFALSYIESANRFRDTRTQQAKWLQHEALYTSLKETLAHTKPDNSNKLIELKHLTSKVSVWLRPTIVIIYLHREKRLFFDTSQSFELRITGNDTGGTYINVQARLIDRFTQCSITRHGWLRYTQFSRHS